MGKGRGAGRRAAASVNWLRCPLAPAPLPPSLLPRPIQPAVYSKSPMPFKLVSFTGDQDFDLSAKTRLHRRAGGDERHSDLRSDDLPPPRRAGPRQDWRHGEGPRQLERHLHQRHPGHRRNPGRERLGDLRQGRVPAQVAGRDTAALRPGQSATATQSDHRPPDLGERRAPGGDVALGVRKPKRSWTTEGRGGLDPGTAGQEAVAAPGSGPEALGRAGSRQGAGPGGHHDVRRDERGPGLGAAPERWHRRAHPPDVEEPAGRCLGPARAPFDRPQGGGGAGRDSVRQRRGRRPVQGRPVHHDPERPQRHVHSAHGLRRSRCWASCTWTTSPPPTPSATRTSSSSSPSAAWPRSRSRPAASRSRSSAKRWYAPTSSATSRPTWRRRSPSSRAPSSWAATSAR